MALLRRPLVLAAVAVSLLGACAEEEVNHVGLSFPASADGVPGFTCKDSATGAPLLARAIDEPSITAVVDFIPLGDGAPLCRNNALNRHCAARAGGCSVALSARTCFRLDVPPKGGGLSPSDYLRQMLAQLEGQLVASRAPEGTVMLRVVLTKEADPCNATGADLTCADLLGCVLSCPVVLTETTGNLELELDVRGVSCQDDVYRCASAHIGAKQEAKCVGP